MGVQIYATVKVYIKRRMMVVNSIICDWSTAAFFAPLKCHRHRKWMTERTVIRFDSHNPYCLGYKRSQRRPIHACIQIKCGLRMNRMIVCHNSVCLDNFKNVDIYTVVILFLPFSSALQCLMAKRDTWPKWHGQKEEIDLRQQQHWASLWPSLIIDI